LTPYTERCSPLGGRSQGASSRCPLWRQFRVRWRAWSSRSVPTAYERRRPATPQAAVNNPATGTQSWSGPRPDDRHTAADGSPRISGIECELTDGDLRFGSMTGARKGADLKRDPRFALHGPTFHPEEAKENNWPGEAKIAGRAVPAGAVTTDEAGEQPDGGTFIADITEVVITALDAEARGSSLSHGPPNEGSEGPSGTSTRSRRSVRRRAREPSQATG